MKALNEKEAWAIYERDTKVLWVKYKESTKDVMEEYEKIANPLYEQTGDIDHEAVVQLDKDTKPAWDEWVREERKVWAVYEQASIDNGFGVRWMPPNFSDNQSSTDSDGRKQ